MSELSFRAIEDALFPFRVGRRLVLGRLLERITRAQSGMDPWRIVTRLFARVKSADSLIEKARRKKLVIKTPADVVTQFSDVLGFRIIADDRDELHHLRQLLEDGFEVVARRECAEDPDGFGQSGYEYELRHHHEGRVFPFEVQLRTFLGHYWAARSFHLFHKQPRDTAAKHADALRHLSAALAEAERAAAAIPVPGASRVVGEAAWRSLPVWTCVHLVVVESGELFAGHEVVALTTRDSEDNDTIVARKSELYERYAGAAIVECSCFDISTFTLNEPVVAWRPDRWDLLKA